MSPGHITRLGLSDEIAFRVSFDNVVTGKDKLYWRGPVFGTFTGRTWLPLANRTVPAADPTLEPDRRSAVTYSVTLEPHKRDGLFALEALGGLPLLPQLEARLTSDMRLLANGLITSRIRYDATSYTAYRLDANLSSPQLQDWLVLPAGFNPRTIRSMTEEPKKAKLQPVQVRLLTSSTEAALVEFEHKGRLSRATVRAADVENGCVDATALEAGIPYGLPWEVIKFAAPKPDQIADALRRAGIWTREDLHRNPKAAIGALQAIYGLHLGTLVEFADQPGLSGKES